MEHLKRRRADRGVVYVACRAERYLQEAVVASESLKSVMPDLAVTLVTDLDIHSGVWDEVRRVAPHADGYRAKVTALCDLPYERTLYLDTDTYVVGDLADLFTLLDRFDLAAAHAPNRATMAIDGLPSSFPELNTGVLALRRNRSVARLCRVWAELYDHLVEFSPPSFDQVSFRSALYESEARLATLTPEYNCRFQMAGFVSTPVKVLHGHATVEQYRGIARLLSRPVRQSSPFRAQPCLHR